MKGYSTSPKAPALLEPHHQIVYCHIQDTHWKSLILLLIYSQCFLLSQLTGSSYFCVWLSTFWVTLVCVCVCVCVYNNNNFKNLKFDMKTGKSNILWYFACFWHFNQCLFVKLLYHIYQPLRTGRIWLKVNFWAEFNRFEFRVFLLLD